MAHLFVGILYQLGAPKGGYEQHCSWTFPFVLPTTASSTVSRSYMFALVC